VTSVSATQSWDTVTITPSGPDGLTFSLTTLTLDGRDVRAHAKDDGPWTYVPTRAGLLVFGITERHPSMPSASYGWRRRCQRQSRPPPASRRVF
jgi:hypothetical protein